MRVITVLWIAGALAVGVGGYKALKASGAAAWFGAGPVQLHPDDPRQLTGDSKIVMLAAEWCGYCRKQRKDFEQANVRYRVLDVDTPEGARAASALRSNGVPVTVIGQDVIHGYNTDALKDKLTPLGYTIY
ncbi:glutaredoxin family protein [Lysobacter silvisoli]|uniref:Glutaredoxin family protein n=1 Tax=Lysobacter silvisoli TaxID=2293254 RepID=A0A371K1D4_9GAMM|nr:glutaredoxin family protein [Lysobacter silvisoli]RDZ27680.1 glutaredoxin family protein [Lysobacter silvisoli]